MKWCVSSLQQHAIARYSWRKHRRLDKESDLMLCVPRVSGKTFKDNSIKYNTDKNQYETYVNSVTVPGDDARPDAVTSAQALQ